MEDYSDGILDTSLDLDTKQPLPVEKKKKPRFNLEECLDILDNLGPIPNTNDEKRFGEILLGLGIFDRSTFGNLEPQEFLKKLMKLMKHEVFHPGTPIMHYNQLEEKLCIIVKGKAKVFIPKTGHEMEKESLKKKLEINTILRKKVLKTSSDVSDYGNKVRSEKSIDQTKSLVNIPEGNQGSANQEIQEIPLVSGRSRSRSIKKLHKAKTNIQSSAITLHSHENFLNLSNPSTSELRNNPLPQSLRDIDEENKPSLNSVEEEEVDEDLMREFKKQMRNYFVGEILKVKFSRFVGSGSHFGIRGIGKNTISKQAVTAAEECHCITLYKEDYLMALNQEKNLHMGKIGFFRKMFPDYEEEILVEFSLLWDKQIYKRGDVIYQENDNFNFLYIVLEGEIIISKEVEDFGQAKSNTERCNIGKKKDNINLQVATLCQGYFFGEEFFKKKPRVFTAIVSSSKAKVLYISLKDYKLFGRKYFEFFVKIKEMIKLSYKFNTNRLESLYQSHGVEINRQAVHEDYLDQKEKLMKLESYSRKEIPKSSRKIINPIMKSKNVNLRLQYDKYFVCKPGQKYPEYLKFVMQTNNQVPANPENKEKSPNQEVLNSGPSQFSKRALSFAPQENDSPEKAFNFVKPLQLSKLESKFNISIPKVEEFKPVIIDTFAPNTTRTISNEPVINPLGKSMVLPRSCKSISKAKSKNHLLRQNIFTERLHNQESSTEEEDKLLEGTSEIIPLDLKNFSAQDNPHLSKKSSLAPLEKIAKTLEENRKNYKRPIRDRNLQFDGKPLNILEYKIIGGENTPKIKSNRKIMSIKRNPGDFTPQSQNNITPSTFLQSGPAKLTIKIPTKPLEKNFLPHIRSKSIAQ